MLRPMLLAPLKGNAGALQRHYIQHAKVLLNNFDFPKGPDGAYLGNYTGFVFLIVLYNATH